MRLFSLRGISASFKVVESTHDCTHSQPNISRFKFGLADAAWRASAGRNRQASGKDRCPFPFAFIRLEKRSEGKSTLFLPPFNQGFSHLKQGRMKNERLLLRDAYRSHTDCCVTVCCVTQRRDAARLKRFQNALRQLAFTCIFDGRIPYAIEGALQIEERYGNSRKPPAWRQFSTMALQRRKDMREGSILCKGRSVSSPPFLLGQAYCFHPIRRCQHCFPPHLRYELAGHGSLNSSRS